MPKVVHVVTTRRFAGVERYVADVALETAAHGWSVTVVGGNPAAMRRTLDGDARWLPGANPWQAFASLARAGRADVCHVHMTNAEVVGLAARPLHRAPVLATRHFAAPRGKSRLGGALAPWIARGLARQIAVSEYVAGQLEAWPDSVLPNAVRARPLLWRPESRVVLVLQRLEPEKDTLTALRAWQESHLADEGWTMRVVGDGSERPALEQWVAEHGVPGVEFAGWSDEPDGELARASVLLAPGGHDSSALAVLEAMSAGVPVVAAAAGGHLESIGRIEAMPSFAPGDATGAASGLLALRDDAFRAELSRRVRAAAAERITLPEHVERLLDEYGKAQAGE
ncbi:MAG TPA: glycosyltransferase family 4 protein [Gaiellaceae bacterium]|nr:glycosyltransferase family 4 protein [Gaiellaceae bacterium]